MMSNCLFCNAGQFEKIAEDELCFAIFDGFPVSPGHVLIIPQRHVESYFDLTFEEIEAMHRMQKAVKTMLDERFKPDGYNIGINVGEAGGQSVFHVHMHIIPRYFGDVPNPKGGVRGVIPSKQSY